ncbi:hypothetical protein DL96DRAFT_1571661, partial [Flagelloscypha sp. PMI_526]
MSTSALYKASSISVFALVSSSPCAMVSIFYRSPIEHSTRFRRRLEAQHACEKETKRPKGQEAFPPVPVGYARVQFFLNMRGIKFAADPDMEAIVRLGPKGELDLSQFKHMWNLENVVPISPWRWDPVPFEKPVISGVSVRMMSDRINAIQLIEQRVSKSTTIKRATRQAVLSVFTVLYACLFSFFSRLFGPFLRSSCVARATGRSTSPPSSSFPNISLFIMFFIAILLTFACLQFAAPFSIHDFHGSFP